MLLWNKGNIMELKKNWKCWLGLHDYEYIERIDKYQLKENTITELEDRLPCTIMHEAGARICVHKICLQCGEEVNSIFPEKIKIISEYRRKKYREDKVNLIQKLKAKRV